MDIEDTCPPLGHRLRPSRPPTPVPHPGPPEHVGSQAQAWPRVSPSPGEPAGTFEHPPDWEPLEDKAPPSAPLTLTWRPPAASQTPHVTGNSLEFIPLG